MFMLLLPPLLPRHGEGDNGQLQDQLPLQRAGQLTSLRSLPPTPVSLCCSDVLFMPLLPPSPPRHGEGVNGQLQDQLPLQRAGQGACGDRLHPSVQVRPALETLNPRPSTPRL